AAFSWMRSDGEVCRQKSVSRPVDTPWLSSQLWTSPVISIRPLARVRNLSVAAILRMMHVPYDCSSAPVEPVVPAEIARACGQMPDCRLCQRHEHCHLSTGSHAGRAAG